LPQSIHDRCASDEGEEHYVPLVEPRKDAPEALAPPERTPGFVSSLVHFPIVFPVNEAIGLTNQSPADLAGPCPGSPVIDANPEVMRRI